MTSAVSVKVSTVPIHGAGAGSNPSTALHALQVQPVPFVAVKRLIERYHYLHSLPGGTMMTFGVLLERRLLGAIAFGAGPAQGYRLVGSACLGDCLALTRLWLSDELPSNSESRVLGIIIRALRKHTDIKFLVSYADPSQGHVGTIYQATGWLYTGLSQVMPLYDLGDGKVYHSRSLAHIYGTHSVRHFISRGVPVRLVPQAGKHRYVKFLDTSWESRLKVPVLPYPKKEGR